jgi:toxin ParE1/3/4
MTPALVVEPAAEEDILLGYRWYEERLVGLGLEFLKSLDLTFSKILEHPFLYAEAIPGVRRSVIRTFPYLVFYACEPGLVHILAIIHAAQNPSHIATRLDA